MDARLPQLPQVFPPSAPFAAPLANHDEQMTSSQQSIPFHLIPQRHARHPDAAHRAHHYSPEEQQKLAGFESISYLPLHTKIYREWLKSHWSHTQWEHWVMMGIIGLATGLIGALLKNLVQAFTKLRFALVGRLIEHQLGLLWLYMISITLLLAFCAAAVIVYIEPAAAGAGVPEVMSYLNGVSIPKVFNARTMIVKYLSVAFAVGSGMYGGNEGPMIHIGSSLGKILSQGTQLKQGMTLTLFKRFRNMYDRRNAISAGAAAGVASAFGAPVGGLLFVLEEISSFWSHKLAWQTFFCCMMATLATELVTNSLEAFSYTGHFGVFRNQGSYAFYINVAMKSQLFMFLPTVILGVLGGLASVAFTWLNLKFCKWRNRRIAPIPWRRIAEVLCVAFITLTIAICLPGAFRCLPTDCASNPHQQGCTHRLISSGMSAVEDLERYTCPPGHYNPAATLFFTSGEKTIERLLNRGTHYELDYGPVITLLIFYMLLACYTAGMAQASGIMVPSLLIGATIGRLFGLILTDTFGGIHKEGGLDWIDPGVFALIGCAAFFAGVTRLTMSLTVIMIELTNDTHFLLPIMTAIIIAKLTADSCMESLYHNLIQLKCLPYLPDELHAHTCLELESVSKVMSTPAVTLPLFGPVQNVAMKLLDGEHSAFPVTEEGKEGHVFKGVILRNHVTAILAREELFVEPPSYLAGLQSPGRELLSPRLQLEKQTSIHITAKNSQKYGVLAADLLANLDDKLPKFQISATDTGDRRHLIQRLMAPEYETKWVNLSPYIDQSSVFIPETFSLERGYNLFRTMGLRHITVVDKHNNPVGILSRKDLLHSNIEDRISLKETLKMDEAVSRKRTMTRELLEKSKSGRLQTPNLHSPVLTAEMLI